MKKRKLLIGIALILIAVYALYMSQFRKSVADAEPALQVKSILESNDCLSCHSPKAELPFYASFPLAGKLIKKDITNGLRYIDLEKICRQLEADGKVSEVDLAKIEQCMISGSMPKLQYRLVHWGNTFNNKEKKALSSWINSTRNSLYPSPLAAEKFRNEPIRPVRDAISTDKKKVDLGYRLFHDTRLSADNTVSCATCHDLKAGGVDGLKTSKGIYGQIGGINAPTVYNAALNASQFWDGRAKDLQAQAGGPPLDALEMGSEWKDIIAKLSADEAISKDFAALYPEGITENSITDAIAEFEKTLLTPDSRFDQYLKGNGSALNREEIEGYRLFKRHNCATCHGGENMGGVSYEHMGIVKDYFKDRGTPLHDNKDFGYFNVTKDSSDFQKFKTPSLRNIALTAPYYHDGTIKTL